MRPTRPPPSPAIEPPHRPCGGTRSATPGTSPVWDSRTLLGIGTHACITHQGETYRLQLTRLGKLILTK